MGYHSQTYFWISSHIVTSLESSSPFSICSISFFSALCHTPMVTSCEHAKRGQLTCIPSCSWSKLHSDDSHTSQSAHEQSAVRQFLLIMGYPEVYTHTHTQTYMHVRLCRGVQLCTVSNFSTMSSQSHLNSKPQMKGIILTEVAHQTRKNMPHTRQGRTCLTCKH